MFSAREDWDRRCKENGSIAYPLGMQTLLYRTTGGNAAAMAIANKLLELLSIERRNTEARVTWTKPIAIEEFAAELMVDARTVQFAVNVLCGKTGRSAVIAKRKALKGHAYKFLPQFWASLEEEQKASLTAFGLPIE